MLNIIGVLNKENKLIKYICDCGVIGQCMIRPFSDEKTIVFDLICVGCGETKRLTIYQKNGLTVDDLTWALPLFNKRGVEI